MPWNAWSAIASIVEWLCENWDQPDEGIWGTRAGATTSPTPAV
jgi:GH15 family glucan-1,4-alpha-glucosidase